MECLVVAALVLVPAVLDALCDAVGLRQILLRKVVDLRIHDARSEVLDDAVAAYEEVLEEVAVRCTGERLLGEHTEGEHALFREAAARGVALLDVEMSDGEHVGEIVVVHHVACLIDRAVDDREARSVDRRVAVLHRDGAGHAAEHIVRMRVLAAEDDVRDDEILLLVEHLEVVRDRHEMHLGREELIVRMIPPLRGEDAELSAVDDLLHLCLDRGVVVRRCDREVMRVGIRVECRRPTEGEAIGLEHRVLECRRRRRIRLQCLERADPVECVEVVEMDDVILMSEARRDDVADVVCVLRNRDAECVLDGTQTAERMRGRADAADALNVCPCIARIAVVHDELKAAPCRAGGDGIGDLARRLVHLDLNAQMSLNTGDRVDNDVFHSCTCFPSFSSCFSWHFFCTRLAPACAATPTAVATASPAPTMSTSMPLYSGRRFENGA